MNPRALGWRLLVAGTARTPTAVVVRCITAAGRVHYIKPNPWALRAGDGRAGWTKERTAKYEDLVLSAKPKRADIERYEAAIGMPPVEDVASCCVCGCTENRACPGGCSWVPHPTDPTKDLCSACLPAVKKRKESRS